MWSSEPFEDYFPHPLPPLAGLMWAEALTAEFGEVRWTEGKLIANSETAATRVSSLTRADEALDYWQLHLAPQLERESAAVAVTAGDPVERFHRARTAWLRFVATYFGNPVRPWVESALRTMGQRNESTCDTTRQWLAALGSLRRAFVDDAAAWHAVVSNDASLLPTKGSSIDQLRRYLSEYGSFSDSPDDFSRPYPADDPTLLFPLLRLERGVEPVRPVTESIVGALVEIADADNPSKYRACQSLRTVILGLGDHLAATGALTSPNDVWLLEPTTLEVIDFTPAMRASSAIRDAERWEAMALSEGEAVGRVWDGVSTPAEDSPLVLLASGFCSGLIASLACSVAAISRSGSATSHCAIAARAMQIPAVACGDAFESLHSGQLVRVDANGGFVECIEEE